MTEVFTLNRFSIFIHDRSQLVQTLFRSDRVLVFKDTSDLDDVIVHLLVSLDARWN